MQLLHAILGRIKERNKDLQDKGEGNRPKDRPVLGSIEFTKMIEYYKIMSIIVYLYFVRNKYYYNAKGKNREKSIQPLGHQINT